MKRYIGAILAALMLLPAAASAASLTSDQANAIVMLLTAFGADASVIANVEQALGIGTSSSMPVTTPMAPHVPVVGSAYKASNLGFDYSYNAPSFPPATFGFGLVGVTGGKAFTENPRINQEYSWAKFGAGAAPTLYMNVNAPYGSAATLPANTGSPEVCAATTTTASTGVSEPSPCAAYNFGYQSAAYAFSYASAQGVSATLWWLDVEDANSWAPDTAVNDQVIQGAIDFLNSKGIRAGIYSMNYMWNEIAGASFAPTQKLSGAAVPTPTWVPIGISDQIGAADYCSVGASFIAGAPVWLVQYEASATAVDQNFSC